MEPLRYINNRLGTIECHVTMEGSFHSRTISKVLEALIGYITRATVDSTNCTGGSARSLTETLPWHIRYGGFTGTLPTITSVNTRLIGFNYLIQVGGTACLFSSTASSPMKQIVNRNSATGVASSLRWEEPSAIPFSSGTSPLLCGESIRFEATANGLSEGPGGPSIVITLVA
jgi:hypothetical protein